MKSEKNPIRRMLSADNPGVKTLHIFFKTKRLVQQDRKLSFLYEPHNEVMGPWTFNITEVLLASIPATVFIFILDIGGLSP